MVKTWARHMVTERKGHCKATQGENPPSWGGVTEREKAVEVWHKEKEVKKKGEFSGLKTKNVFGQGLKNHRKT